MPYAILTLGSKKAFAKDVEPRLPEQHCRRSVEPAPEDRLFLLGNRVGLDVNNLFSHKKIPLQKLNKVKAHKRVVYTDLYLVTRICRPRSEENEIRRDLNIVGLLNNIG